MRRIRFWSILRNIFEEIKSSDHGSRMTKKKMLFYDKALAHSSIAAQPKLAELKFDILLHSYSPDLNPSDLFPNSKFFLVERDLSEEVINNYFKDLEETRPGGNREPGETLGEAQ